MIAGVTDRLEAEQALKEGEERYRRLLEVNPDAIYVHQEGRIVLVNDGIEPARLKTFAEARAEVITAYQAIVERQLVEQIEIHKVFEAHSLKLSLEI